MSNILKPLTNIKEVDYKMITTHPYFKTLSEEELASIIAVMDYDGYEKLKGKYSDTKAEILYNQFQIELMKEKEIIGYICPQDLFSSNWPKGTVFVKDTHDFSFMYKPEGCIDSSKWSLPKEIVETWEPVYAQEQHKIGDWVNVVNPGGCYPSHPEAPSKLKDGEIYNAGIVINPGLYKILRFDSWNDGTKIVIVKSDNLVYFLTYQDSYLNYIKPASTEEIKNHLVKEAKVRRFDTFVKFTAVRGVVKGDKTPSGISNFEENTNGECGSHFIYDETKDCLLTYGCGLYVVYENGVWATIKPQEEVVTLSCDSGSFELEVSEKGIYFRPENQWINSKDIKLFAGHNKLRHSNNYESVTSSGYWNVSVDTLTVGCKSGTKLSDWQKVLDIYNKFNKI